MRTVTAPDGAKWQVKRHWISRKPRWRDRKGPELPDLADIFSIFDDTPIGWFIGIVLVVVIALFFSGFFLFVIELVIVLLVLAITLASKVLFRRPWFVDAWSASGPPRRWAVVGWRRSGQVVEEVARAIEDGVGYNSPHARSVAPPRHAMERWANEKSPRVGGSL